MRGGDSTNPAGSERGQHPITMMTPRITRASITILQYIVFSCCSATKDTGIMPGHVPMLLLTVCQVLGTFMHVPGFPLSGISAY